MVYCIHHGRNIQNFTKGAANVQRAWREHCHQVYQIDVSSHNNYEGEEQL